MITKENSHNHVKSLSLKIILFLCSLIVLIGVVSAGNFGLDRNSGDIVLSPGTLDLTSGYAATSWDAKQGFQISLLKEESDPLNDVWEFNHYNPGGTYDWTNHNFVDYDLYILCINKL